MTSIRTERDHKAAKKLPFPKDTPEAKYCELLTSHASDFVVKQLSLMEKVKQIQEKDGVQDCDCIFRQSMKLPCRHMLVF